MIGPLSVHADERLQPYVYTQAEYHSNLLALRDRAQGMEQNGDDELSDLVMRAVVGLDSTLAFDGLSLRGNLEARRVHFGHYDALDHSEYLLDVTLGGLLPRELIGDLAYRQERRMATFSERDSGALAIELERVLSGQLAHDLSEDWHLQAAARGRRLDAPLPDAPGFRTEEAGLELAVQRGADHRVIWGLRSGYTGGRFAGHPVDGEFRQYSVALTADHEVADLYRVGAQLGHTQREDEAGSGRDRSGVTGVLAYERILSAKTRIEVQAFRRIRSYIAGPASEQETGADLEVAWQPTLKIGLTGAFQWTHSAFEDSPLPATFRTRSDRHQIAALILSYEARPWLVVRPYLCGRLRDSNRADQDFDGTLFGIGLQARLP